MLKPTAPTGVFPNGGDGDRWSYMRDGRVVWSGSREECERRYAAYGGKMIAEYNARVCSGRYVERAIRAV